MNATFKRFYFKVNKMDVWKYSMFILILANAVFCQVNNNDTSNIFTHGKSEILSRKKRFLIFPEGSSLQLVFCNTYPVLTSIGDIFLFGLTAALAWELPQDPYSPFNHKADPLHRRKDSKSILYTDENGRIIYKRPYGIRKLIVNPAFAKRSVDGAGLKKEEFGIERKQMHASKNNRDFSGQQEFHRSTRASLYQKIEAMLQGLGGNGRECLLKTLCIVGKSRNDPQGSFLEEILRATFTLPPGASNDDLEDYDTASSATEPCETLYSECKDPLSGPVMY